MALARLRVPGCSGAARIVSIMARNVLSTSRRRSPWMSTLKRLPLMPPLTEASSTACPTSGGKHGGGVLHHQAPRGPDGIEHRGDEYVARRAANRIEMDDRHADSWTGMT
ncbi:MAG: hypothetical protein R3A51_06440 [Nannocystaceae bacterium]